MNAASASSAARMEDAPLRIVTIAHNHPDLFPGGAEGMAYRLFEHFGEQPGIQSSFIAATDPRHSPVYSGTPLTAHKGNDEEMLLQAGGFDYFMQSLKDPAPLNGALADYLKDKAPDIVHIHHTLRLGMELIPAIRQILPYAKIVYTLHDFMPLCYRDGQMVRRTDDTLCDTSSPERCHQCFPEVSQTRFKLREQFIRTHFDRVDAFIAPSRFLAERYIEWGLPEHKLHVLPNGLPAASAVPHRKLTKKSSRNHFAYFGQITPYKGVLLLCEAARRLQEKPGGPEIKIDIYGHVGEQSQEFQQCFHDALAACGNAVAWHGRYTPEALPRLMATADWVVVPSTWWENAPLVIDEALQHQRPVISSNIGGMAEKIRHLKNGLHFHAGSADSLANTLHKAADSPELWQKLVRNIAAPVTLEDCARQHTALYRSLRS